MRSIVWIMAITTTLFGAQIRWKTWPNEQTFSGYLEARGLGSVLRTISAEDMQSLDAIRPGERFYELWDEKSLRQVLIPLGEEMQIELIRRRSGEYAFDIVPIDLLTRHEAVVLTVKDGVAKQIKQQTGNPRLGWELSRLYGDRRLFRTLRPQDRIAFVYTQKERLGWPVGRPTIEAAVVETHGKRVYRFVDAKGKAHPDVFRTERYTVTEKRPFTYTTVHKVPGALFRMPLDKVRITSRFSYRRWHPILKKYRPHFGVDFGAKRGTPLRALNDGRVVYAGWMRGYGNVVKIDHGNGLVSLYAHQSKILVKKGQKVTRGQTIGRVGSTGRSTGPHLHLGLYRHGKPVDPLKYISRKGSGTMQTVVKKHTVMKDFPIAKERKVPIPGAARYKKQLKALITQTAHDNYRWIRPEKPQVIHALRPKDPRQEPGPSPTPSEVTRG